MPLQQGAVKDNPPTDAGLLRRGLRAMRCISPLTWIAHRLSIYRNFCYRRSRANPLSRMDLRRKVKTVVRHQPIPLYRTEDYMNPAMSQSLSYAALFDPAVAMAAAKRATQWNLPRHICHPLDRTITRRASPDLAAFDAAVDMAPIPETELPDDSLIAGNAMRASSDSDLENEDDL